MSSSLQKYIAAAKRSLAADNASLPSGPIPDDDDFLQWGKRWVQHLVRRKFR